MMIVKLPAFAGSEPFAWAMENCPSFEKRTIATPRGEEYPMPMFITRYDMWCYHFESDSDAIFFTLRWR